AFSGALRVAYGIASGVLDVLSPFASLLGNLVSGFAALPGPVQTAAAAFLAFRFGPQILGSVKGALGGVGTEAEGTARKTGLVGTALGTITAPARAVAGGLGGAASAARQFSDEMSVQRNLARASGESISFMG